MFIYYVLKGFLKIPSKALVIYPIFKLLLVKANNYLEVFVVVSVKRVFYS